MPGLMILSATFRCTGCFCSATNTLPNPPSPIASHERVGPDLLPGTFADFAVGPGGDALGGPFEKAAIGLVNEQQGLEPGLERGIAFAGPRDVTATSIRGLDLSGSVERWRLHRALARSWLHSDNVVRACSLLEQCEKRACFGQDPARLSAGNRQVAFKSRTPKTSRRSQQRA